MVESAQINLTLHTRPITRVQYNYDGDLVFASSLDSIISLWDTEGNIKGTYNGHQGAVTCMEQMGESLLTGSSDRSVILWDTLTGKQRYSMPFKSTVKSVNLSDGNMLISCDDSYNNKPTFNFFDLRSNALVFNLNFDFIITSSILKESLCIFGDAEGNVNKFDLKSNKVLLKTKLHNSKVNEITQSPCSKYFISSSTDATSKIFDSNLKEIKSFQSTEPVNSSAIFPENNILVNVGGISARDVTLTRGKRKFDVNFYDIVGEERVGFYSPHFGTINTVDVSRDGKSFISGGEDGIIVMIKLGDDFTSAPFTNF